MNKLKIIHSKLLNVVLKQTIILGRMEGGIEFADWGYWIVGMFFGAKKEETGWTEAADR